MIYNIFEMIIIFLEPFCNPIGITGIIVAVIMGVIMCKFTNFKAIICVICSNIFIIVIGMLACILNNTPDYLYVPIFFTPFLIIFIITIIFYYVISYLINMNK